MTGMAKNLASSAISKWPARRRANMEPTFDNGWRPAAGQGEHHQVP